jgi:type IV pilus assembly protein PilB
MVRPKLGDLLLEANLIDEVQLQIALEEQKNRGTRFGSTLVALHFIDENVLTAFLARQLNMPCVSFNNIEVSPAVLRKIPRGLAVRYHAMPVRVDGDRLLVALCDPMDLETIESLEAHTGMVVSPMVAPQSSIEEAIARFYPEEKASGAGIQGGEAGLFPELIREIQEMEVFGEQFREIRQRLDRIEGALAEIRLLLSKGGE